MTPLRGKMEKDSILKRFCAAQLGLQEERGCGGWLRGRKGVS